MEFADVNKIPISYQKAVAAEFRGTVREVTYRVCNYINSSRQLVTNQQITREEAGRETVEGDALFKQCNVYLPAGYNESVLDTKYNVLYLLHGVGGNRNEWLDSNGKEDGNYILCNILDHLIANGEIDPLIVVFPDGRSAHDWTDCSFNAEGTNMLGFYYFDYELRYDLIPYIESTFHTFANIQNHTTEAIAYNRTHRAIAGLSMGGMQSLNMGLGGYRCDSNTYTGRNMGSENGLDTTILAPGMEDLFAYVGAFSNAPTSSEGKVLGTRISTCGHRLTLLYITCGDADRLLQMGYQTSIEGLQKAAGYHLENFYQVLIKDGDHNFLVWNNGAYNFLRLAFDTLKYNGEPRVVTVTLDA